jgi:hypothetical protein
VPSAKRSLSSFPRGMPANQRTPKKCLVERWLVFAGGARTLTRPDVRELHMEVDERSSNGTQLIRTVEQCGLVLTRTDSHGIADLTFVRPGA